MSARRFFVVSSPHPWGCFLIAEIAAMQEGVFPTPVGVFREWLNDYAKRGSLPHTRGGVSKLDSVYKKVASSSPHPWGCFFLQRHSYALWRVFPTPVGVFLAQIQKTHPKQSLPHTRGGVSAIDTRTIPRMESSPHPWGCFFISYQRGRGARVFPTPVGVFPVYFQDSP